MNSRPRVTARKGESPAGQLVGRMMLTTARMLLLVASLGPAAAEASRSAHAQQRCGPAVTREQFNAFFGLTIGEWQVTVRDFDESGARSHESRQVRRFAWTVGNRYIEEKALTSLPDGELRDLGMMLYSFDDAAAEVLGVSFWPRSPRRWADVTGCLDESSRRLAGTVTSHRPNEPVRTRRVEIVVDSSDRLRWRGFGRTADGREYLAEELLYQR